SGLTFSEGIVSSGFGTLIKGNTVAVYFVGIFSNGDVAQVSGNQVTGGIVGIEVAADGASVTLNDVGYATNSGMFAEGSNPVLERNKVTGGRFGVEAVCDNCYGGSMSLNTVSDAGFVGALAISDSIGLHVDGNVVARSNLGVSLNGPGMSA